MKIDITKLVVSQVLEWWTVRSLQNVEKYSKALEKVIQSLWNLKSNDLNDLNEQKFYSTARKARRILEKCATEVICVEKSFFRIFEFLRGNLKEIEHWVELNLKL